MEVKPTYRRPGRRSTLPQHHVGIIGFRAADIVPGLRAVRKIAMIDGDPDSRRRGVKWRVACGRVGVDLVRSKCVGSDRAEPLSHNPLRRTYPGLTQACYIEKPASLLSVSPRRTERSTGAGYLVYVEVTFWQRRERSAKRVYGQVVHQAQGRSAVV